MKLNITIAPLKLNGYTNISPLKGDDIFKLSIENNSCTDIIVETINVVPISRLNETIHEYVSKLRHGGLITIIGTQTDIMLQKYFSSQLSIEELNNVLFGTNKHVWDINRCAININDVFSLLKKYGLKIEEQYFEDTKFIIKGRRL